jgi:hypothetical protein
MKCVMQNCSEEVAKDASVPNCIVLMLIWEIMCMFGKYELHVHWQDAHDFVIKFAGVKNDGRTV